MSKSKPKPVVPVVVAPVVIPPVVPIPDAPDVRPQTGDNPRHAVLICDDRDGPTRAVTVRRPGEHTVMVDGALFHHTHEGEKGRWIYTRMKP